LSPHFRWNLAPPTPCLSPWTPTFWADIFVIFNYYSNCKENLVSNSFAFQIRCIKILFYFLLEFTFLRQD
jgi:hypothetical protein